MTTKALYVLGLRPDTEEKGIWMILGEKPIQPVN